MKSQAYIGLIVKIVKFFICLILPCSSVSLVQVFATDPPGAAAARPAQGSLAKTARAVSHPCSLPYLVLLLGRPVGCSLFLYIGPRLTTFLVART